MKAVIAFALIRSCLNRQSPDLVVYRPYNGACYPYNGACYQVQLELGPPQPIQTSNKGDFVCLEPLRVSQHDSSALGILLDL